MPAEAQEERVTAYQIKDGRWCVGYRAGTNPDDPKRTREYFGRGLDARNAAIERDAWIRANWGKREIRRRTSPTFAELASAYLDTATTKNTTSTITARFPKFTSIILPAIGHIEAMDITPAVLDRYVRQRLADHVMVRRGRGDRARWVAARDQDGQPRTIKRTTIHRELSDINAVLNWAVAQRYIAFNPVAGYRKPRRDDAVIMPPTTAEVERIMAVAAPHLLRALTISYFVGVRPGPVELYRSLTWDRCDLDAGSVLIESASKNGLRARIVPVHPGIVDALRAWEAEDRAAGIPWVIHFRGRPVERVKTAWATAKRKAGITRRMRMYDFRHAFASAILAGGGDLKAVSQMLGHSRTDTTTAVYQHVTTAMHRAAVDRIPSVSIPHGGCSTDEVAKNSTE